ncbi:MAG TPA: sensor histidine kinase [Acidimicrobiales bacterium]|nr:sensor histidine kinase [Acidimicrobiales bacterium]
MERQRGFVRLAELGRRLRRTNPWLLDAVLASVFLVLVLVGHFAASRDANVEYRDPDVLSVVLSVGVAVPFYFRRYAPLAVLLISEACVVALTAGEYQTGAAPTILLVAVYTVAAWCSARDRAIGVVAVAIGLTIVAVAGIPGSNAADTFFTSVLFAAAYLVGATVRNRRLYSEQLEERARTLERDRDEQARRAVAEERLHIAQDLHDVVAHSMGVIAVQAGVGAHVIDTDPEEAKHTLEAISQTSRSTLAEIRRMLGVLRDDQGASYTPAPGLADLDKLLRDVSGAGLEVSVRSEGTRAELPPGVDFTAYRIVQEALTNVLKHAGRARATVVVGYEDGALRLEIEDDGRGVNGRAVPGGHGLLGMRERVSVYGGSLEAGPRTGGGFRVSVRLPYGGVG